MERCSLTGRYLPSEPEVRFWGNVDVSAGPGGCWPWKLAKRSAEKDYGIFWMGGKNHCASRVAFYFANGFWPTVARHSCDNPACCNPRHLLNGTTLDDNRDCAARRRTALGERNGNAKLSDEDRRWLRWARTYAGVPYYKLGPAFGVSTSAAHILCTRSVW